MAVTKELTGTAQKLAHNITFSGYDLVTGGGNLSIASKWYIDGIDVSGEEIETISIMELRSLEADKVSNLDTALRQLCEIVWSKK